MHKGLLLIIISSLALGQETEIKEATEVYAEPGEKISLGQLKSGVTINKLKKDPTGRYIKARLEFYISVEALMDPSIYLTIGEEQFVDRVKYKLVSGKRDGKQVRIRLEITNNDLRKDWDFSATAMLKLEGKNGNKGELNPFVGKYQDLAILKPFQSITAELVYEFKSDPENVILTCTGKMGGERIFYSLGF